MAARGLRRPVARNLKEVVGLEVVLVNPWEA
jgi:hypothetical protein